MLADSTALVSFWSYVCWLHRIKVFDSNYLCASYFKRKRKTDKRDKQVIWPDNGSSTVRSKKTINSIPYKILFDLTSGFIEAVFRFLNLLIVYRDPIRCTNSKLSCLMIEFL